MNWFTPDPVVVLVVLGGCTAMAGVVESMSRRSRKRGLRQLASRWGMTYSSRDRLRITEKIAGRLPIPGAADVYVADVLYNSSAGRYRYIFTAEYTVGVVRAKHRQVRVAAFGESRDTKGSSPAEPVVLAPEGLTIPEQYEKLASDFGAVSTSRIPAQ